MRAEERIQAVAWELPTESKESYLCRLQINGIKGKTIEKRILKAVKDWSEAGCGTCPEEKEKMLMFSRIFKSRKSWLAWAKEFPFSLKEATTTGKYRNIKTKKEQ